MNPNQIFSLFMAGKTNIFGTNPAPALVATIWITYSPLCLCNIHNCWYRQFELLISTIRIVDINNCSELLNC